MRINKQTKRTIMENVSCSLKNNPGIYIMVGLIVLAIFIGKSVSDFKAYDRIVSVKGLCEKEVNANQVIWPLVYKEVGNELESLYQSMNKKNETIIAFLKSKGITEEEISISAPDIIDMKAMMYQDRPAPYRYNITAVLTVSSNKVDKIRSIIVEQTDLLKQGIVITGGDYRYSTQYLFNGLNDIKPQMIEEATKSARVAAEKFAKDSESKLGKIRNANQGQFSITDRDANTPYIKIVRVVTSVDYYLND